jgi:hypothetical protein
MWQGKLALNTITSVVLTAIQLILVSYMLHNRMQSMKFTGNSINFYSGV